MTTKPHCMTASGLLFEFENPQGSAFDIEDVASALSRITRFNGHILSRWDDCIYSVAQHSVYVWEGLRLGRHDSRFWGLMHDACEAYFGDTIKPLKELVPKLELMEDRAARTMRLQWGIPYSDQIAQEVHWADRMLGCAEAFTLKGAEQARSMYGVDAPPMTLYDIDKDFTPWGPREARIRFLQAYRQQKKDTMEQQNHAHAY